MNDRKREDRRDRRNAAPSRIRLMRKPGWVDWKKHTWMSVGIVLFCMVYFCPPFPDAVDPQGEHFKLTHQGKAALALFLLAATWWVFEVVPICVTSIAIGVTQVLFLIRPAKVVVDVTAGAVKPQEVVTGVVSEQLSTAKVAFGDFMDPAVWFMVLDRAIRVGNYKTAAQAQEQLAALGVYVRYRAKPAEPVAPREVACAAG